MCLRIFVRIDNLPPSDFTETGERIMTQAGLIELDPQEVFEQLKAGDTVLVDVREDFEFQEEHIADSILSPMSEFDAANWAGVAGKKVILSCKGGMRSASVAADLIALGLGPITHMRGGLIAWKEQNLPTIEA